jgi:hypothetical protein
MRISCRLSSPRAHNPTFHRAFGERAARTEPRAHAACRLHARVRGRRWDIRMRSRAPYSAVVGLITDVTSDTRFAGKPPCRACSRTMSAFGAR